VRFRLLGPVEIESEDGGVQVLARRRERCLLAILLLERDRLVPVDRLCELLWDGDPPDNARRMLHSHVARIRATLDRAGAAGHGVAVVSQRDGYLMRVDADLVDAHQFRSLLDRAAATADLSRRDSLLGEALELWRGPALHHAASNRLRDLLCRELEELRLGAVEESIATGLALGRHRELTPELVRLTASHPSRERLVELYMLALYRAGRTADALDVYAKTRAQRAEELGLDPSERLQRLHEAILRGEPVAGPEQTTAPTRPAQLPADLVDFAGRAEHLLELDALLSRPTTAVVISAIAGTAGVGKTALAVHWAHSVVDRFPDGQLYVNLRGFDPRGPLAPGDALRGLLDALEVPLQRIPVDFDAQVGLYRTRMAGKRMLVVLDNAADAEQVRPLLPGSADCLTVVTSRRQLPGLVATDGAYPLTLDLLSLAEARELLARRLGPSRVAADPDAVAGIIDSCARLPLALAVVAARAVTRPSTSLADLAAELRQTRGGLDSFTGDDRATDVRAVFSWSYQRLSQPAARLLRLLGACAGPEISTAAVASLAGATPAEVGPLLAELTDASLLSEPVPDRYTFHDLLRAYAAEQARATDNEDDRQTALHRLLDHYLHTAHAADLLLAAPREDRFALPPAMPEVHPEAPADYDQAMAWLTTEHQVLIAAVRQAADAGFDRHTWQLAWAFVIFLDLRGHWSDLGVTQNIAFEAATRLDDARAQARILRAQARAASRLGRDQEAEAYLRRALDIYRGLHDDTGQAATYGGLAFIIERQGRYREALDHGRQMLNFHRADGSRRGQATALNSIGWCYSLLGDHGQALAHCEQALALLQEMGDRYGQAAAWDSIGYAHHHLGDHSQAAVCFRHALDIQRELGDRQGEGHTLTHLGDTHRAAGDIDAARTAWQRALTILDDLADPDAEQVRTKLRDLEAEMPARTRRSAPHSPGT
jgi:DNA-binding SARP family transcriptional activator/tetratricopeptide (TPR) repeat protein